MQMNPSLTIERKRVDCSALPKGWQREEVRKSANSTNNNNNKVDVFYYSPTGKRIESKPQLARQLGSEMFDIGNFDFQTGKMLQHQQHQRQLPSPSISLYRCSVMPPLPSGGVAGNLKRKYSRAQAQGSNNGSINTPTMASAAAAANAATTPVGAAASATSSSNLRHQQQFELR